MIYFKVNTLTDFGLGVSFRMREIKWYDVYTIEIWKRLRKRLLYKG